MNQYLNNLMMRSLNQAEVVRPRPISLFEPSPLMGKTAVPHTSVWNGMEETAFKEIPAVDEMVSTAPPLTRLPLKRQQSVKQQSEADLAIETMNRQTAVTAKTTPPFDLPPAMTVPVPAAKPVKPKMTTTRPHNPPMDNHLPEPAEPVVTLPHHPVAKPVKPKMTTTRPHNPPADSRPLQPEETAVTRPHHLAAKPSPVAESPVQQVVPALSRPIPPLQPAITHFPGANQVEIRREIVREVVVEQPMMVAKPDTLPPKIAALPSPVQPFPLIHQAGHLTAGTAVQPAHAHELETSPRRDSAPIEKSTPFQPQIRPFVPPQTIISPEPKGETTPTINVTIGRIEVRATPPPTNPTRRDRPAAPTMGLDEYLRQRNGGQP